MQLQSQGWSRALNWRYHVARQLLHSRFYCSGSQHPTTDAASFTRRKNVLVWPQFDSGWLLRSVWDTSLVNWYWIRRSYSVTHKEPRLSCAHTCKYTMFKHTGMFMLTSISRHKCCHFYRFRIAFMHIVQIRRKIHHKPSAGTLQTYRCKLFRNFQDIDCWPADRAHKHSILCPSWKKEIEFRNEKEQICFKAKIVPKWLFLLMGPRV